jgi:hypothetical protein
MKETWRITRCLTRQPLRIPPLIHDGTTAVTVPDKLKVFADSLRKTFSPNPDVNKSFTAHTQHLVEDFLSRPFSDHLRPTNHSEIAWLIRHAKSRSAPGPDGIQNIILQNLPSVAHHFIATIFNKALTLNYFPTQWKVAKILMFPKPGKDPSSPLGYRPISLLNSLGKLFEKIILKRMNSQIQERNLLRDDQFGFKRGHSTIHALLRNVERITQGFNHKKSSVMLLLDIERAFDKVWIHGLVAKLIQLNFSPHLIHLLYNYLHHRSFYVSIRNSSSEIHPISAGVPQGSLLGPTLFNLFINDFPQINTDPNLAITLYADDAAINVRSGDVSLAVRKLNAALALLEPWLLNWRIQINIHKSSVTIFSKRRNHLRGPLSPVTLFNQYIPWINNPKYLGVTLDSKMTFKLHITHTLRKLNYRLRQLYPIINRSSSIDIHLALTIYKALIRPIMTYACPVWGFAALTHINKLQAFQNKTLRIITKLPKVVPILTLHDQTHIPLILTYIKSLTTALYHKTPGSTNFYIQVLGRYSTLADKHNRPLSILHR